MIRLILVVLAVVIFLITMIPALFILWIIGKFNKRAKDIISLRMVQVIFRIALFFAGTKITVIGKERIPQDEPVLYVGNHRSFFDILVTYIQCKNCTGYISKKEIEKVPLLVNWMRNLHCLFLDREDTKQALKMVLDGIALMKQGVSMCIFPEGTRGHVEGEIGEFKGGAFKMAEKTGCANYDIQYSSYLGRSFTLDKIRKSCCRIWRAGVSKRYVKRRQKAHCRIFPQYYVRNS